MQRTIRVFGLALMLPLFLQCDSDSSTAVARRDFDLTGEWSVSQGRSATWSCSGQLESAGPSLCWTGFFVTLEQNDGRFHATAFQRPVWIIGPVLCEGQEFSGQIAGTDVSGVLKYEGSAGPLTVTPGIVRVEFEGAVDESGDYPVVTFEPTRVTVEGAEGECQMSVSFTAIPTDEIIVGRP